MFKMFKKTIIQMKNNRMKTKNRKQLINVLYALKNLDFLIKVKCVIFVETQYAHHILKKLEKTQKI